MSLEEAKERIRIAKRGEGKELDLSKLGLTSDDLVSLISNNTMFFQQIDVLRLESNQISIIPSEICGLTNLAELGLGGNQISIIPSEICGLTNLAELGLGG